MKRKCLGSAAMLMIGFLLLLGGCGSSGNKEGDTVGTTAVGDRLCVQCHSATLDKVTNETIVAQYNRSPHYLAKQGCEGCHGNGGQHNGVGPIPYPAPDAARCATCHDGTKVVGGVTLTKTSSTNWATSNHAIPYEETTGEICYRCHTSEGAILSNLAGYTGDKDGVLTVNAYKLTQDRDFSKFTMGVNCNACHEHGGGLRQVMGRDAVGNIVNWDPNVNRKVDQFDLCTSCHNLFTYDGATLIASGKDFDAGGTTVTSKKFYHETAWFRQIASTHYDLPQTGLGSGTGGAASAKIEGYVIRKTGANPCFDCHGHEFKANTRPGVDPPRPSTNHTDWAQSAHAGKLLTLKYAADPDPSNRSQDKVNTVMAAGVVDETGAGWSHYDWDAANRQSCQRCHTATGASNFMTSPATYNAAKNNFTHLSGWTGTLNRQDGTYSAITSSPQNEMLYCWGCHTNAGTGELRKPGALTFTYTNNATVTYPDVSGSNVCMACHTGRETGDSIKNDTDADGVRSFLNSHYLAAGGQLFGTTGYEYAGKDYTNPAFFTHDKIGSAAAPGTGSNGPCAGCHMSSSNKHLFTNVTKDGTGAITAITSTACAACHTGNDALTPAKLIEEEEDYGAALEAAKAVMASKGIYFFEAHPYWYQGAGGTGGAYTNWAGIYGLAFWKDVMGAAFNINLLIHDPGGYAHNRYYVKRLLWDSIDFITDGTLGNVDMTATIDGTGLTPEQKTAAKAYLGTARP